MPCHRRPPQSQRLAVDGDRHLVLEYQIRKATFPSFPPQLSLSPNLHYIQLMFRSKERSLGSQLSTRVSMGGRDKEA